MFKFEYARLCGITNSSPHRKIDYVERCVEQFKSEVQWRDHANYDHSLSPRVDRLHVQQEQDDETDDIKMTSTLYIASPTGYHIELDITEKIGGFNPIFLIYLRDIAHIDVSGCTSISPLLFVDCIPACTNLRKLTMRSCTQFTEMHFMQMIPKLQELTYLCLENCQELSYPVAYWIMSSLRKLTMIDFEPANRVIEIVDWKSLYNVFFRVQFGISFKRIMPHYGSYVRIPDWLCEE